MEPVTHMLTGAVLARAGVNRRAAYATFTMAVAAELPDLDVLWSYVGPHAGPVTGLLHHRGITHTFVGIPLEAALVTACAWGWHRWRAAAAAKTKAPANWPVLYAGVLLALASHLLLDWTNNYGLRPFFPFNPRWYAGSFVFIFEPVMFLILLAALLGPVLFGLINGEIGARRSAFRGRPSAIAALCGIGLLYGLRAWQRDAAMTVARAQAPAGTTRIFASPHPVDPFTWSVVMETPAAYHLATVHSRIGLVDDASPADTLVKPAPSLPLLAAKRSYLGRVYLDWSQYPVLAETPDTSDPAHPLTTVTFSDARFHYDTFLLSGRKQPPLRGAVTLDMQAPEGERVVETTLNGSTQR